MLIDWWAVGFGALWIVGLSLNLIVLSMADYRRAQTRKGWREVWQTPGYQVLSNLGLACFCVGLSGSARAGWEKVIWGILGLGFAVFAWQAWRARY